MRIWLPGWALLLYLAIDLANPFVPGAFRFTPEEGFVWVEGMSLGREGTRSGGCGRRACELRRRTCRRPPGSLRAPTGPARAWRLTTWLARVRTGDPPARDLPPPSSDDH